VSGETKHTGEAWKPILGSTIRSLQSSLFLSLDLISGCMKLRDLIRKFLPKGRGGNNIVDDVDKIILRYLDFGCGGYKLI